MCRRDAPQLANPCYLLSLVPITVLVAPLASTTGCRCQTIWESKSALSEIRNHLKTIYLEKLACSTNYCLSGSQLQSSKRKTFRSQPHCNFPMFAKSNRPTSKLTFRILDLLEHPGEYVLLLVRSNHDSYLLGVI